MSHLEIWTRRTGLPDVLRPARNARAFAQITLALLLRRTGLFRAGGALFQPTFLADDPLPWRTLSGFRNSRSCPPGYLSRAIFTSMTGLWPPAILL